MQLPYFYVDHPLTNMEGVLNEETSRHISQVLRMEKGNQLQLTNGKGLLHTAEIIEPFKKQTSIKLLSTSFTEPKDRKIAIGISLLKNISRFEWFLEKVTEIGVDHIITLRCSRSERQNMRKERMQNIIISAMLQSRQVWLPKLIEPENFDEAINHLHFKNKFIAHCAPGDKPGLLNSMASLEGDRITLIGPEGDFTQQEIQLAIAQGYTAVSLGKNRLRTETAGIAACIIMNVV